MKQIGIIIFVGVFILTTVTIQPKEDRNEIFESIFIVSGVFTIAVAILIVFNALFKKFKAKKFYSTSNIQQYPQIFTTTTTFNTIGNPTIIDQNQLPNYNQAIFNVPLSNQFYPPKYETAIEIPPPPTIEAPPSYHQFI
uniref:Uncharacterized protein n=1 Tax=Panagrolaimus sp. PS1159 TaxID=55785 RepID=A0AC35FTL4_9BILA